MEMSNSCDEFLLDHIIIGDLFCLLTKIIADVTSMDNTTISQGQPTSNGKVGGLGVEEEQGGELEGEEDRGGGGTNEPIPLRTRKLGGRRTRR